MLIDHREQRIMSTRQYQICSTYIVSYVGALMQLGQRETEFLGSALTGFLQFLTNRQ